MLELDSPQAFQFVLNLRDYPEISVWLPFLFKTKLTASSTFVSTINGRQLTCAAISCIPSLAASASISISESFINCEQLGFVKLHKMSERKLNESSIQGG